MLDVEWSPAELRELEDLRQRESLLPADAPRALLSIRLSVLTDETTSPVRQELDLRRFALLRGCRVAGVARDLNVSATKVPPWKRPELGDWINNRAPEFDQILFWKLDRFVRRISDLHLMIEWCKEYGKILAADKDPIDLDSAYGEMMVTMIAGMARIEAANTGVRLESLWKYARTTDRWVIGKPIYGYVSEETPDGRKLVIHPFRYRVLHWIYDMLVKRERSMYKITQIVNRAGIPSPGGGKWYAKNLTSILTNPALKGLRVIRPPKAKSKEISRIVYDAEGKPIKVADPLFTDEEFDSLQNALKQNAKHGRKGSKGKQLSRFLGVCLCGNCKANMYKHISKKELKSGTRYYPKLRCSTYTTEPCGAPVFDPDEIYGALADTALDQLGDYEVIHREYARGAENLARVNELQASIKHYMDGLAPGGSFSVGGFIQKQAEEALQKFGAELASIDPESTQDRWLYKSMGVTYRQHWAELGIDQMEKDLLRGGITFLVHPDRCELLIPDDVKQRLVVKDDYFKKKL